MFGTKTCDRRYNRYRGTGTPMPLIRFRNFLAASRKRNMLPFNMVRSTNPGFIDVIEDYSGGGGTSLVQLGFSGVQNGVNTAFTVSSVPTLVVRNGLIQDAGVDYTLAGNVANYVVPPLADDLLLFLG